MIPVSLAVVLRQYGYDVLAAKEANMFGKSDEEQLDFAVSNRMAIITFNIKDFVCYINHGFQKGRSTLE